MFNSIRSARPLALVVALSLGMVYAPITGALPANSTRIDVRVLNQGQPLRGVDVQVVNLETAEVALATTDQAGNVVLAVDAGVYQVTAKARGFLSSASRLVSARANTPAATTMSMAAVQQEYSGSGKVTSASGNTLTLDNGDTITVSADATFSSEGLYFSVGEMASALSTTDAEICVAYNGDPVTAMVAGSCGDDGAVLGAAGVVALAGAGAAGGGIGALAIAAIVAGGAFAVVAIVEATSDDTP